MSKGECFDPNCHLLDLKILLFSAGCCLFLHVTGMLESKDKI